MDQQTIKVAPGTVLKTHTFSSCLFDWFWSTNGFRNGARGHHKWRHFGAQRRFGPRDPLRISVLMDLGCFLNTFLVFFHGLGMLSGHFLRVFSCLWDGFRVVSSCFVKLALRLVPYHFFKIIS